MKIKIDGAAAIEELLKKLPERMAKAATFRALRKGGKPIVQAAKQKVHVRSGELRDSITVSSGRVRGRRRDQSHVAIGFRRNAPGNPSPRAHLEEFGTEHSPAHPFMRPALDEKGAEAIDIIGKELGVEIEKEAIKLAQGPKRASQTPKKRRR